MKVAIGVNHGGFSLSDEAIKKCIELGMTLTRYDSNDKIIDSEADFLEYELKGTHRPIIHIRNYGNEFRCNPIVIQVIEELGTEEASGEHTTLKIVEIPFDGIEGWFVDEEEGWELIREDHRTWGN